MAPIVDRFGSSRGGRDGAIAQLGERVVRNDEVGGSIPPGSTTLRPSGYAWRSHAEPEGRSVVSGVAHRAKTDCPERSPLPPRKPRRTLLHKTRHALPKIAAVERDQHPPV